MPDKYTPYLTKERVRDLEKGTIVFGIVVAVIMTVGMFLILSNS